MDNLSNWLAVNQEISKIERRMRKIVKKAGSEINQVGDHFFSSSGKRIRPLLFYTAAFNPRLFDKAKLLDAAVAIELIHTASLLHDDVIDQASVRRGNDTVHVRWNNKIAILCGDFLLSEAFGLLSTYQNWPLLNIIINLVRNMAEGEIEQAFARPGTSDLEEYYFQWIGKKSAAFFAGCCQSGSLLGGAEQQIQRCWYEFGYNLGIAFQLIDDLLDYTGRDVNTGKARYGDLRNRVITLPLIKTIHKSNFERLFLDYWQEEVVTEDRVAELAAIVLEGDGPAYTFDKAVAYIAKAKRLIEQIGIVNAEHAMQLNEIIEGVLHRDK